MKPAIASRDGRTPRAGAALVLVLAGLMLVTVLVLGFLASVSTELQSSKAYASGSSVKLLAQSSVDLVMAEIRDATANPALCWTSQPGMIRTFDNTGQNAGAHAQFYKLYSDSAMSGTGAFDPADSAQAVPANWFAQKGVYVDLNEPLSVNGVNRYPILNGDAGANASIAGFNLAAATPADPAAASGAPMPVKWLYMLKEGQIIAPNSGTGASVTFPATDPVSGAPVTVPSAANPIIGRMAFWTDDETCKVNINTASEAANPWDYPRLNTVYDRTSLAVNQPVQHEFQRYPGHPATVCLSTVLGSKFPVPTPGPNNITSTTYSSQLLPYFNLTPRVVGGVGETVSSGALTTTSAGVSSQGGTTTPGFGAVLLTPDVDRLYESVDELMFAPNRTPNSAALTQTEVETAKFFLTAQSRAPDTNLFNQPRICMWPISSQANSGGTMYRSPADQLIAFCSQVGRDTAGNPFAYYFQRLDPNDQTVDLPSAATATGLGRNRSLIEYLRYLTQQQIPGFGGAFSSKYNSGDLLGGGSIVVGTTECDQILTEMVDYIRSTNTRDQSIAVGATNPVTPYTVPFSTTYNPGNGTGQVLPLVDTKNGTRGFGRFPTLQQAGLIFYVSDDNRATIAANMQPSEVKAMFVLSLFDPSMGFPYGVPWYAITVEGLNNVTGGTNFTWDGTASTPMFTALNGNPDPQVMNAPYPGGLNQDPMLGGTVSFRRMMYDQFVVPAIPTANFFSTGYPSATVNPGHSPLSTLGVSAIHFRGGPVTIKFYRLKKNGNSLKGIIDYAAPIQTLALTIPDAPAAGFPLPAISPVSLGAPPAAVDAHIPYMDSGVHYPGWESWTNRKAWMIGSNNFGYNSVTSDNDTIRTVIPTPGDLRLAAARQNITTSVVGAQFFKAHPAWDLGVRAAHNLQSSAGNPIYQASVTANQTGGSLVALTIPNYEGWTSGAPTIFQTDSEYRSFTEASPYWSDVPSTTGVFTGGSGTVLGDWDNGISDFKDGCYINKADEGDYYTPTANNVPYYVTFGGGSRNVGQTFFSPNRMVPSAGMFGSLPTGVLANKPWQTLLFRPGPAGHPGLGSPVNTPVGPPYTTPPDSLMLDLFSMPVVEPYAISEPLSTAGRINMNYQIVPFTYITRNTGMQAVLKSVQLLAVPDSKANTYKWKTTNSAAASNPNGTNSYRFALNITDTLKQFDARFANKDVFRSPAEICSIDLLPSDYTGSTSNPGSAAWRTAVDGYWNTHRLTGDNSRERPYANIYSLLTTRSNTFTIHYRVQSLQGATTLGGNVAEWKERFDAVQAEYRGSQTIERYVDPNDTIPDYAAAPSATPAQPLSNFYKFRVVSTKQFAP